MSWMFNRHYPFILPDSLTQEIETDRSSGRTDAERTIQGTCFFEETINLSAAPLYKPYFRPAVQACSLPSGPQLSQFKRKVKITGIHQENTLFQKKGKSVSLENVGMIIL